MERLCPAAWLFDVTNPMPRDGRGGSGLSAHHPPAVPRHTGRTNRQAGTLESGELTAQGVYHLPERLAAVCREISDVHVLVAAAVIEGSRDKAREVVEIDPAVTDKAAAHALLDDLIDLHLDLYPHFDGR